MMLTKNRSPEAQANPSGILGIPILKKRNKAGSPVNINTSIKIDWNLERSPVPTTSPPTVGKIPQPRPTGESLLPTVPQTNSPGSRKRKF